MRSSTGRVEFVPPKEARRFTSTFALMRLHWSGEVCPIKGGKTIHKHLGLDEAAKQATEEAKAVALAAFAARISCERWRTTS